MSEPASNGAPISGDVVIAGGGPVGMGLAIDLGQRGIATVVIERYPQPQPVPKGQNLTQRSGEHFRAWGVSKEIRAAAPIPHEYGSAGVTAYGALLSGYAYDWFRRAAVGAYYAAENERLPQYATEAVLRRRAAALDAVEVLYGWSATGLDQDEDGVAVRIRHRETGAERAVRARYAVGCDGSGSTTRDAAGIGQEVDPHDRRMVLLVFRSRELHDLLQCFPGKSYYNVLKTAHQGYWQFLGRVDLDGGWFFHAPVPAGTTRDSFDFAALLHDAVGAEFAVDFTHIGFWDLRIAIAKSYRSGRVFIAGDAAHSHPPYGGYGINTGFEDARNLGWKLEAALGGWAGPGLLDSYDAERRPVFASTARDFIGRMICEDRAFVSAYDPEVDKAAFEREWANRAKGGNTAVTAYVPHYSGSPIVVGADGGETGAVGTHDFAARPGHHLAPQPLSDGRSVHDALGAGFSLLSLDRDGLAAAFAAAARRHGVPLTVIEDTRDGGRERYGAATILIRPDHFVAWAGTAPPEEAEPILLRAIGG